ncbi:ParB N-terminal domain-containing protein [Streptomyces sp. UNOB3_S3]|uniref:ParB N-terminal domain-containing protein n=1 Tax=Streptomyces sp. UNOB3_S3 TaxID=2871682 RepID=UPI001E3BEEDE|nr:ParB N-terminal domain-containing protein [Streptomyces sp. UNOB3_S3]MCC3775342.1 ParB N-terminal domain-containing protein [Streptomyces sp. UNOB3_S3]
MKYRGQMKTSFLNDRQIRPTEYDKWHDAVRYFDRRDKDRAKVQELKESIRWHGVHEPLILGISDRYPDVYVADGHHRAVALMALRAELEPRARSFPFHWYWIKSSGVRMEHEPFPCHLLDC